MLGTVVHCFAKTHTCCVFIVGRVSLIIRTTFVQLGPLPVAVSYQEITSSVGTSVDLAGRTHKSGSSSKGANKEGGTTAGTTGIATTFVVTGTSGGMEDTVGSDNPSLHSVVQPSTTLAVAGWTTLPLCQPSAISVLLRDSVYFHL